ncbi:MAG: hypothetical protein ACRD0Z_08400 [Acidimicrobiales bacterium]
MEEPAGASQTSTPDIKPIKWDYPSAVLGGERTGFTPWLSRNLGIVADALGLDDLELTGTEVDVAGKRLDILAASGSDPNGLALGVAIEAQYGVSDHDHLGKLVTYAAGASATKDRVLAVWLVDEPHPAHVAAVEMLNRETSDRLGFVLARTRFTKTGTNSWGVVVEVISKPNEFIREQQREAETPPNPVRHQFLTDVLDLSRSEILAAGFGTVSQSGGQGYYAHIRWPGEKRWFVEVRGGQLHDGFRAMVYVNSMPTTGENEAILKELEAHDDLVRAELGGSDAVLAWDHHVSSPWATVAALGECHWPGLGYSSDPVVAADHLTAFCRGIAKAATAARSTERSSSQGSVPGAV